MAEFIGAFVQLCGHRARGGHGPKMGGNALEEEDEEENVCPCLVEK